MRLDFPLKVRNFEEHRAKSKKQTAKSNEQRAKVKKYLKKIIKNKILKS
jgi:hypothetical protein